MKIELNYNEAAATLTLMGFEYRLIFDLFIGPDGVDVTLTSDDTLNRVDYIIYPNPRYDNSQRTFTEIKHLRRPVGRIHLFKEVNKRIKLQKQLNSLNSQKYI